MDSGSKAHIALTAFNTLAILTQSIYWYRSLASLQSEQTRLAKALSSVIEVVSNSEEKDKLKGIESELAMMRSNIAAIAQSLNLFARADQVEEQLKNILEYSGKSPSTTKSRARNKGILKPSPPVVTQQESVRFSTPLVIPGKNHTREESEEESEEDSEEESDDIVGAVRGIRKVPEPVQRRQRRRGR